MSRVQAVLSILAAFLCGFLLHGQIAADEPAIGADGAGGRLGWLVTPLMGLIALVGVWQAVRPARRAS